MAETRVVLFLWSPAGSIERLMAVRVRFGISLSSPGTLVFPGKLLFKYILSKALCCAVGVKYHVVDVNYNQDLNVRTLPTLFLVVVVVHVVFCCCFFF